MMNLLNKTKSDDFSAVFSATMRRYCMVGMLGLGGLIGSAEQVCAQEESLIQQEIQKRSENVVLAQELLVQGDAAYKNGKFGKAVEVYSKAFALIPEGERTQVIKAATAQRYAQAAAENAKVLSRTGQYEKARRQLNAVLADGVAPGNPLAKKMLEKLDDPIRTSPTLTPEHVNNIVNVGKQLRAGESLYNQGQFDEAIIVFKNVIRIDPYNKAARRGMEKVNAAISEYANAARDQARAKLLQDVDETWELKVRPKGEASIVGEAGLEQDSGLVGMVQNTNSKKLERIMVADVNFRESNFDSALRTIRIWARELDTTEIDPKMKGLNFVTRFGDKDGEFAKKIENVKFDLQLKNVPLSAVMDNFTKATGTFWTVEGRVVVIRPVGAYTAEMTRRTFRVPLGFMEDSGEKAEKDPFAEDQAVLKQKVTAKEYFEKLGIGFPEGSAAFYNKRKNTLTVTNTPLALEAIDDYIREQTLTENVQVIIKMTIMEVTERNLKELSFDHLLQPAGNNTLFVGGGNQGSGAAVTPLQTGGAVVQGDPITSGLRSGTGFNDAIADRIAGVNATAPGAAAERAPGILAVTGQISDSTFQTILRGVKQKDGNSKIWVPSVVTKPGQRASLYAGDEFFYAEEYEAPEIPNGAQGGGIATPATPTAFVMKQLGMQIEVEPTVTDDKNYIHVNVKPVIQTFQGYVNYGSPLLTTVADPLTGVLSSRVVSENRILMPVFRKISTDTNVTIRDGSTLVIGGLLHSKIEKIEDKVPILGSMPFFGRFFRSDSIRSSKTAILIFVKAELVDPTGRPWRQR